MPLPQASTGSASASAHSASVSAATAAYMSRQDFTHRAINFEEMLERERQRRREQNQRVPAPWEEQISESLRAVRSRDIERWQRQVNRVAPRSQGSERSQTDFQSDDLAALEFEIINRSLEVFHSPNRCPHCDTVLSGVICTNDLCSNELASGSSSVTIDRTGMLVRDQNGMVRVRSGTSDVGSHTHHINNASIQSGSITGRSINHTWIDEANRIEEEMSQSFRTWLNDNSSVGATGNTGGF